MRAVALALAAIMAVASGCAKRVHDRASPAPVKQEATAQSEKPAGQHGMRKLMGLDVPVFVDGVEEGVLRFGDLPRIAEAKAWNGAPGWRLSDYLRGIGVAPEGVRAIHLHANGDRIGSIEGSELASKQDRFVFSFLSGDTGSPVARWDTTGLKNPFVVHEIRKLSVFVKKDVPPIDPVRQCHLGADGSCTEAVPYAMNDAAKGTRLYVDGKMVGFVKRRQLGDGLIIGETAEHEREFSLARFMATLGVRSDGIKGVDLVAGDEVIARADESTWSKLGGGIYFISPPHSHGKVRVHVPIEMQAHASPEKDRDALITSVLVYRTTAPSARAVAEISEETDLSVQVASAGEAHEEGAGGRRASQ